MAIIQIKRRTSSGTGPIVGSSGTVKAGEPLIDLNGGIYIFLKRIKQQHQRIRYQQVIISNMLVKQIKMLQLMQRLPH